jgi:hypothetical protein
MYEHAPDQRKLISVLYDNYVLHTPNIYFYLWLLLKPSFFKLPFSDSILHFEPDHFCILLEGKVRIIVIDFKEGLK